MSYVYFQPPIRSRFLNLTNDSISMILTSEVIRLDASNDFSSAIYVQFQLHATCGQTLPIWDIDFVRINFQFVLICK